MQPRSINLETINDIMYFMDQFIRNKRLNAQFEALKEALNKEYFLSLDGNIYLRSDFDANSPELAEAVSAEFAFYALAGIYIKTTDLDSRLSSNMDANSKKSLLESTSKVFDDAENRVRKVIKTLDKHNLQNADAARINNVLNQKIQDCDKNISKQNTKTIQSKGGVIALALLAVGLAATIIAFQAPVMIAAFGVGIFVGLTILIGAQVGLISLKCITHAWNSINGDDAQARAKLNKERYNLTAAKNTNTVDLKTSKKLYQLAKDNIEEKSIEFTNSLSRSSVRAPEQQMEPLQHTRRGSDECLPLLSDSRHAMYGRTSPSPVHQPRDESRSLGRRLQ